MSSEFKSRHITIEDSRMRETFYKPSFLPGRDFKNLGYAKSNCSDLNLMLSLCIKWGPVSIAQSEEEAIHPSFNDLTPGNVASSVIY